jgi:hypothetical protein
VTPDATHARSVARRLTTLGAIDSDLMREAEAAALAVNSVWSLFAMWGPTGGYDEIERPGMSGGGMFSCCHTIGTSSRDHGTGRGSTGFADELRRQLGGAVSRCKPRSSVTVSVETTLEEIITVDLGEDGDSPIRDCITEAIWDTSLTLVTPPSYARTRLTFQPD